MRIQGGFGKVLFDDGKDRLHIAAELGGADVGEVGTEEHFVPYIVLQFSHGGGRDSLKGGFGEGEAEELHVYVDPLGNVSFVFLLLVRIQTHGLEHIISPAIKFLERGVSKK